MSCRARVCSTLSPVLSLPRPLPEGADVFLCQRAFGKHVKALFTIFPPCLKSTAKGFFPDSNRKKKVYEPFSAPAKPLRLSGAPACQLPETEKAQNRSNARKRSPRQELALFSGWGESNPAHFPPFPLRLHRSDIYLHDFICLRFSQRINHGLDFS